MLKKIASTIKNLFSVKKKKQLPPGAETVKPSKPVTPKKQPPRQEQAVSKNRQPRSNMPAKPAAEQPRQQQQQRRRPAPQKTAKQQAAAPQAAAASAAEWDAASFVVPPADGKTRFQDLNIHPAIMHAVADLGFKYLTPIQAEALPQSLKGDDIVGQAQTGTGKTAAFLITMFNHMLNNPRQEAVPNGTPRALVLAPTRELVLQIEKDARGLGKYTGLRVLSLLGGMHYQRQQNELRQYPIDALFCTPGRLIDFMKQNIVDLRQVEILVIDEADRMLDMGFIPDVKRIVSNTPFKDNRQTLFFSATLTHDVKRLAESWTRNAREITVKPDDVVVTSVEQITYITTVREKPILLYNLLLKKEFERVLVFVNRRDQARRLKEKFEHYGISSALLSGDIEQSQRIRRLERFREGNVRVLVATDVASRGIHVEGITHVINYNMPQDVEEYVHRVGRTGRAGATGISISFADEDDAHELHKLEEYLGKKIECTFPEEVLLTPIPEAHRNPPRKQESGQQQQRGRQIHRRRRGPGRGAPPQQQ